MGCNSSIQTNSQSELLQRVKQCIERNNSKVLHSLIISQQSRLHGRLLLNDPIAEVEGLRLNSLGYALWLGRAYLFRYMYETLGASLSVLEDLLRSQRTSILGLICQRGHLDILQYYLPLYMSTYSNPKIDENISLDFDNSFDNKIFYTYTPIQTACELGHMCILDYVFLHFKDTKPPEELDIHMQDSLTGENCALIAARTGNYPMMKFLYERCKADFKVLNNSYENAIQIAALGSTTGDGDYLACIKFLVEKIGVDLKYNYEETLLHIQSYSLRNYVEKKLKDVGINASKSEIEKKYEIRWPKDDKKLDGLFFDLKKCEMDDDLLSMPSQITFTEGLTVSFINEVRNL
ncbi:unnamed protein product [Blepharisma stoltei]|uniref:Ankyrin repeat protein n=1 Tax=Blepharisma stoltei TaxID=1481888 RepID=A0AAU9IDU3_9CILI|nr:unnamed protein product [Blepharisma stoltei]